MADPLSIAAILALIYAGRRMASEPEPEPTIEKYQEPEQPDTMPPGSFDALSRVTHQYIQPGILDIKTNRKQEVPSFGDTSFMKHVNGEPVHDFSNRMYVSGQMNNLSPAPVTHVGRGIGLDPSVPAAGGYQQLYRVNPNNVGAYKLTTLPGRIAPGGDITGGRSGLVGELTHFAPSKTAYLPSRYPNVQGRAQGQGGAVTGVEVRPEFEKTKRTTNRAETSYRGDALQYAPAKSFVSGLTKAQPPTRNKADLNDQQFAHTDNPAPGIHSFVGAFTERAEVKLLDGKRPENGYSNKQLEEYGLRGNDDRRAKKDRPGNAGRMNVRNDPLKQGGMVTAVRSDSNRYDGYTGPKNGAWGTQNYVKPDFQDNNPYKENPNPLMLNLAKNQLLKNPFAHSLSA
jgi:hypothetical protein